MSADQITRTLRLHLRAMMLARFFQPLEFGQQVVGLFVLPIIAKQLVSQFALEGLYSCKTESIPYSFKGCQPIIEQFEVELGGERG